MASSVNRWILVLLRNAHRHSVPGTDLLWLVSTSDISDLIVELLLNTPDSLPPADCSANEIP